MPTSQPALPKGGNKSCTIVLEYRKNILDAQLQASARSGCPHLGAPQDMESLRSNSLELIFPCRICYDFEEQASKGGQESLADELLLPDFAKFLTMRTHADLAGIHEVLHAQAKPPVTFSHTTGAHKPGANAGSTPVWSQQYLARK